MPTRALGDRYELSSAEVTVRIGTGGAFTAYASYMTGISDGGQTKSSDSFTDLSGQTEVTSAAAFGPGTLTLTVITTDAADGLYKVLFDEFRQEPENAADAVDIQFNKKGAGAGDLRWTTSGGQLTNVPAPAFDSTSSGVQTVSITLDYSGMALSTI